MAFLFNLTMTGLNAYWVVRAYNNPHIFPKWYLALSGAGTLVCAYCAYLTF